VVDQQIPETASEFEETGEQAETEAALQRDLEHTFPTSDPASSWAGPDIEPERSDSPKQ
jgi:hypothetical protein